MNTVFPLLQSCFLLYPFYCPLTPPFPFSLEKAPASQDSSVIIFINIIVNITFIIIIIIATLHGARASTAISQMRPNI
jgi:hypothetical protein